jgi:predicted alpha/beta superfamily hydrolase
MLLAPFLATLALAAPLQAEPAKRVPSLSGNVEKIEGFTSKVRGNTRNLIVYLPPQYDKEPKRRFPVLYVHDGQNVFDGMTSYIPNAEWKLDEAAEALIQAGMIEPIMIVGIDNAGADRGNEYLPIRVSPNGRPDRAYGGRADDYGKMIMEEVKPMIDAKYRTKTGPRDTGLMGSSFGGIITLYLGMKHPDVFGKLAVVSPSLWVGNGALLKLVSEMPKLPRSRVWVDMGLAEGNEYLRTRQLAETFRKKGYREGRDFRYFEDPRGEHNEPAWARRAPLMLMFLFGR